MVNIILFLIFTFSSTAYAGDFQILTNDGKSGLNQTHDVSVNFTNYRNGYVKFRMNTTVAAGGYFVSSSYIDIYCGGYKYVNSKLSNKVIDVPGNKIYTINLWDGGSNNCATLGSTTIRWKWGGWIGPSLSLSEVEVWATKDAPVASNQSISVNQNSSSAQTTLTASDPQGVSISRTITQPPTNGSLSWDPSGLKFVYTPNTCFSGSDSFKYNVTESLHNQDSAEATVSITVVPTAVPVPSLNPLSNVELPWYGSQSISLSGIAAGTCGGAMTVTATSSDPSILPHPTVSYSNPNSTGSITLNPKQPTSVNGQDVTITVTVNNGVNQVNRTFNTKVQWVNILFRK